MPRLCTATQEPLRMEGTMHLHVRLGDVPVRVWAGIVHNPVVNMILCDSFINRCICGIFSVKPKVVPMHFYLVAILSATPRDHRLCTSTLYVTALRGKPYNNDEANIHTTSIAREV